MLADLSQFASVVTWWWLPSFGSQLLLNFCYSFHLVTPPATSAHRLRNNHLQLARTVVILATLLYQLYDSISNATPNYYQLLGLPLDVDSEGVKRSFRALARKYHPDKVGASGETFFILLRRAHDALSEPTKRFAYDRFGPEVSDWKDCESVRDFVKRGLMGLVAFYTIHPVMYALFGWINNGGRSDGISFWRLACLFSLLAFELSIIVSPDYPAWLAILMPNTTIHNVRILAHSLFVNFFFASLQLSNALDVLEYGESGGSPARDAKSKALLAERQLEMVSVRAQTLNQVAAVVKTGMLQSFARELRPFRSETRDGADANRMGEMEEALFQKIDDVLLCRSLIQQHPQLLSLIEAQKHKASERTSDSLPADIERETQDQCEPHTVAVKQEPVEHSLPPLGDSRSSHLEGASKIKFEVKPEPESGSGSRFDREALPQPIQHVAPPTSNTAPTTTVKAEEKQEGSPPSLNVERTSTEIPPPTIDPASPSDEPQTHRLDASVPTITTITTTAPNRRENEVQQSHPRPATATAVPAAAAIFAPHCAEENQPQSQPQPQPLMTEVEEQQQLLAASAAAEAAKESSSGGGGLSVEAGKNRNNIRTVINASSELA